ncbi:MAG: MFS transporter, partial [Chlamydiia bacterium]|nr:MFS transporter [Chlamydiia bacterium]
MIDENHRSFRAILSVLFLDNLALIVVYPIFTPLVLKPIYTLLPQDYPLSYRLILLGILIASFPFAQFLAGPFIGHIADIKGRKYAFTLALIGEGIGFLLTGIAIFQMNYLFLFFSRLFTGFFAGNMTICLSSISDLFPNPKQRSQNFGAVSSVVGMSFVVAIVIGGVFSNKALDSFFSSSLPFWAMAIFSIINLGIIQYHFTETHPSIDKGHKHYFSNQIKEILSLFKTHHLNYLYALFFFFMLGWIISLQFLSSFLIEHFTGTKLSITLTFIGMGLSWCIGNLLINRILTKYIKIQKLLFYTLILSCITLFIASEAKHFLFFIHLIIFGSL